MAFLQTLPRPVKTYHAHTYDRISPSKTTFSGGGKTVLITGGATGIGLAISKSFAEAGVARIIIVSRSPGPQAKAKEELNASFPNTKIETFQVSMTNTTRFDELLHAVGHIDVLVLCAAAGHQRLPNLEIPLSEIDDTIITNVLACYKILRTYLSLPLPPSSSKTVLNVSSAAAHITLPQQTAYGPSKAAFLQMIGSLELDFPLEKDVRMFSFHPGVFLTDLARSNGYKEDAFDWEDIRVAGHFAVWLTSPEAEFLAGRFVWAEWDVDELIGLKKRIEEDPTYLKLGLIQ